MVKVHTSLVHPKAFRSVILGAPASGKGTVSSRIVNYFGITHISSGDKLRDHVARQTGFPRTVTQAQKLQQLHPMNHVLNLVVPHSIIIERVKNRWVHLPSGRVYNVGFNDPKVSGRDDVTGEPLSQRIDDKPEVVAKRLTDYVTKTEKVIEYYRQLGILNEFKGNTTDEMWPKIRDFVNQCIYENK
ncbi:GTP:AMP phosphotransferase AK3, mitochondrial isoform X2 [Diachasmimorpha longicaudata]|uniref:GTP:AMP phosphotransferase AK3, mitochondrial isoform X2 n=1 Tax=Diachasmimorpha longicaudata TaxID=58733 RepID=UPI0030B8AB08